MNQDREYPFSVAGMAAQAEDLKRQREAGKVDPAIERLWARADKLRIAMADVDMGPEEYDNNGNLGSA